MESDIRDVKNLLIHGYDDYIASRALMKTEFIRQAMIHASTAVEKYLKALILFSQGKKAQKVHLDKLPLLRQQFKNTPFEHVFDSFDSNFIDILGKVYTFRYLDNIRALDSVGFLVNQFLGELDFTISTLEACFKFCDWETPYQRDFRNHSLRLYRNNWKLERWPKRIFMQQQSSFFGITYDPITKDLYDIRNENPISVLYTGRMYFLVVKFEK